ncbi:MAG: NAD(P)-dependent oxidoreductase [Geobacteraceae bacterium]|nr:NAD(P)-dependent oxidoreductase [Geobacteraceae bacterium]
MRILVTGAGGFIGRILAEGLQSDGGHEVVGLCRRDVPPKAAPGVTWMVCDLSLGIPALDPVDYIIHTAALPDSESLSTSEFIGRNLAMAENIALFAQRVSARGVIYTSSVNLNGDVRSGLLDENSDRINPSRYGVSKYLCETVFEYNKNSFPTVSLRLCGVVGRGAHACWLAQVLSHAVNGDDIPVFNEKRLFNNLVHTDDLLDFVKRLVLKGFSGFNAFPIASENPISIGDVVAEIIKATGSCSNKKNDGITDNSFMISNRFAMEHFQYSPLTVIENLKKFAITRA